MKTVTLIFLAFFVSVCMAVVPISQLPLKSANVSGVNDSFPFVDATLNVTSRMLLSDLINLPAMSAKFSLLIPDQVGNSGKFLTTNGTVTSWATVSSGGTVSVSPPLLSTGGSSPTLSMQVSDSSHDGYLSQGDWSTFNGKQAAGSYITALTGDAVASGPGSASVSVNKIKGVAISATAPTDGQVLKYNNSTTQWEPATAGGGGGTPGGSDKQIQYNNAGVFGGAAQVAWDSANNILTVGTPPSSFTTSPTAPFSVYKPGAVAFFGNSIGSRAGLLINSFIGEVQLQGYKSNLSAVNTLHLNPQGGSLVLGPANLIWPAVDGTSGQVLVTDGFGGLSWTTNGGGGGSSQWTTTGSDIYYNTGKVGIGNATPTFSLDVGAAENGTSGRIGGMFLGGFDDGPSKDGIFTAGGYVTSTGDWTATGNGAGAVYINNNTGALQFFSNAGLTPATTYSPNTVLVLGPGSIVPHVDVIPDSPDTRSIGAEQNGMQYVWSKTLAIGDAGSDAYVYIHNDSNPSGGYHLYLPQTVGAAGQAMVTDGAGNLSWVNVQDHITYVGPLPSLTNWGTGSAQEGNDSAGRITAGTGATGLSQIITFHLGWTHRPICTFFNETVGNYNQAYTVTTADVTFNAGNINDGDVLAYHCVGY